MTELLLEFSFLAYLSDAQLSRLRRLAPFSKYCAQSILYPTAADDDYVRFVTYICLTPATY